MADVVVALSADETKLLRAYQRIRQHQDKVDTGHKRNKRGHKDAFGTAAVSNLARYAAGMYGITAALGTVKQLFTDVRQEADRLGERQRQSKFGMGSLAQLAESDAQMRAMVAQAKKTFAEGATETLDEAGAVQFTLESAGLGEYRRGVSRMLASGVVKDAKKLVDASAGLQTAFSEAETGRFEDIVSKGYGASKGAPASIDEILQAAGVAGSAAAALGLSDEELLAAIPTVAKVEGPETAGTQVKQLLAAIEKKAIPQGYLTGRETLPEMIATLQQKVEEGGNIRSMLGDEIRAIAGFRTLAKNQSILADNLANVQGAIKHNEFGATAFERKIRFAEQVDPGLIATKARQQAVAREELTGQTVATTSQLADALEADLLAYKRDERWFGELGQAFHRMWFAGERMLIGDRSFVKDWKESGSPETQAAIERAAAALERAADSMETAAESQSAAGHHITAATQRAAAAGVAQ